MDDFLLKYRPGDNGGMSLPVKRSRMLNPKRHTAKAGHNKAPRRRDRLSDVKFTVIPSLFFRCHHSNATPNVITSVRKAEPSPSGAAASPLSCSPRAVTLT